MLYDQTEAYLKETLFDFVAQVVGNRDIYFFGENFNKPAGPYVVIKLSSLDEIGYPTKIRYTEDGREVQRQDYEANIDIVAYRGSPIATLSSIRKGCTFFQNSRKFKDKNIGFLRWGGVIDRTVALDGVSFEKRASQSYTFSLRLEVEDFLITEDINQVNIEEGQVGDTNPYTDIISGP